MTSRISANATLMRHSLAMTKFGVDINKMIREMDLILAAAIAAKEDVRIIDQYQHMRGCYGLIRDRLAALNCAQKGD